MMEYQRFLLSGGSGFLGGGLTDSLLKDGYEVTWLTRDPSQPHPDRVTMLRYDELSPKQRYDVLINLAGAGIADARWSDKRKSQLRDSRLQPTQTLLDYIEQTPIKPARLISGSAIGWYGAQGDLPLDESSHFDTDFAHELCADWEALAQQAEPLGVPVTILRTGVVMGCWGGMLSRLKVPFQLGLGGKLGSGQQIMSWISRQDWVSAVRFLLDNPNTHGVYNLTAPNPVTNAEFTKALGKVVNRPTILSVPGALLKLGLGEMSTLLLDGQKVLPQRLTAAGFNFQHQHLAEALAVKS